MSQRAFKLYQNVKIINKDRFEQTYKDFLLGKTHFAELKSEDMLFQAFETEPTEGYEQPDKFPYCCIWHEQIFNQAKEKLDEFPGCCDGHKKLIGQPWFDKMEYSYLPQKVVNTISYTLHCVDTSAGKENWFKAITDYIEYTATSYGQFPFGYGAPLGLTQYLSCIGSNIRDRESLNENQKTGYQSMSKK